MEGGREKPGWCLVLQVRRWEECRHLVGMGSSPESRRSTADQRANGLPLRKCHTHLNPAEEQPWGLPSNERTLTVSCNSLSHNLGSAKWRKRFWRNCRGRRIYTASRTCICMLRDNWPVPIGLQERLEGRSSHNGEILRDVSWKLERELGKATEYDTFHTAYDKLLAPPSEQTKLNKLLSEGNAVVSDNYTEILWQHTLLGQNGHNNI